MISVEGLVIVLIVIFLVCRIERKGGNGGSKGN